MEKEGSKKNIGSKKEDFIMTFTKSDMDLFVPKLDKPITEEEYLKMLKFRNEGFEYDEVFKYDPERDKELDISLEELMEPK